MNLLIKLKPFFRKYTFVRSRSRFINYSLRCRNFREFILLLLCYSIIHIFRFRSDVFQVHAVLMSIFSQYRSADIYESSLSLGPLFWSELIHISNLDPYYRHLKDSAFRTDPYSLTMYGRLAYIDSGLNNDWFKARSLYPTSLILSVQVILPILFSLVMTGTQVLVIYVC